MTWLAGLALFSWVAVLVLPWQPHRVRERIEASARRPDLSDITVLIPARNEADGIERTVRALASQGPGLKVVVVDDESTDDTAARLAALSHDLAQAAPGEASAMALTVMAGEPRPAGWSGKLWALEQGLRHVGTGKVLLLDADIELAPGTVGALLERATQTGAALVTVMATLRAERFAERLLSPPFVFFFKLIYPFALAADPRSRVAAAAGGCILIERRALDDIGGFAALRTALIDDCTLAANVKARGHRLWIGMSRSVRSIRPYTFSDFWRMVERTAFTQLRCSAAWLAATTVAMLLVFVVPIVAVLTGGSAERLLGLGALTAMMLAYWPTVRFYGLPVAWVLTLPAAGALFLAMTWSSAIGYWRGVRARWKGRDYAVADAGSGRTESN